MADEGKQQDKPDQRPYLRDHRRFRVELSCNVSCRTWDAAQRIAITNLSRGGMFLRSSRSAVPGSEIQISVMLPDGQQVKLAAEVRHCCTQEESQRTGRPAGLGVAVRPESLAQLEQLVELARQRAGAPVAPPEVTPSASVGPAARRHTAEQQAHLGAAVATRTPVFGIDFGLSYSSIAIAHQSDAVTITDAQGRALTPSLVWFDDDGTPVTGWEARERQATRPERAVPSIKRLLGRRFSDSRVARLLQTLPLPAAKGPADSILLRTGAGEPLAVYQVASLVLQGLRQLVQQQLGLTVDRAVLTHPVSFDDDQLQALRRAAELCGITVEEILAEPLAAALAYGRNDDKNEIIAVYDLGGGTFNFTLLDLSLQRHRVLAAEGDDWLGGDDIDRKLARAVASAVQRRTGVDLSDSATSWQRLLLASERAKCSLTAESAVRLLVPEIALGRKRTTLRQLVDQPVLEQICRPLVDRSLAICQRVFAATGLEPTDVTQVVLTGGSTQIPFVRQAVERLFERSVPQVISADESVGLGAAVRAARL